MSLPIIYDKSNLPTVPPSSIRPREESINQKQMTCLEPWLGLRSRIFLSLFPYGLVALLFVGTRLLISASQASNDIQHSNATIWSACRETEQAVSTLVSFPHLLADNFNSATKRSVDDTVQGLGKVLLLSFTAIESLLVFLVDMYKSMFLCFLQFVVQSSIALLITAVQVFSTAVHDVAQSIQTAIQASVDAINTTLSTTLSGFNDILSIIGKSITIPTVPYPNLSALSNVTLPSALEDSLVQLNNSLPTLADLKTKLDQLIQTPFEDLKTQVNSTISNYAFNQSALPVPSMQSISYCNDTLDTQPLQDLNHDLTKAAHIGIGLLVLLAALFLIFNVVREWYSWRSLKKHVVSTREAFVFSHGNENNVDVLEDRSLMSLLQLSTHLLLAAWGLKMATKMGVRSTEGKDRVRWWLAWISHPVGIVLLIMGLVGLLSVEFQIAAVKKIGHHYQDRFRDMADQSASGIQGRIDAALQGMSTNYANKSNAVLQLSQDDLNNHLFEWVNVTTSTMNNTLNDFMDGIATAINETFANTPLFTPVQSFINCILGQKVKGIEDGLTWIQSNAHVSFPVVPDDVLMVSPNATQQVMQSLTNSTLGSNGVLADVIGSYERTLEKERVMFIILLQLYLLLFVIGTLIAATHGTSTLDKLLRRKRKDEAMSGGHIDKEASPFDGFVSTMYNRSTSPAATTGHRSISKPLHPDVMSLYQQNQTSAQSTNGLLVVANPTSKRCSWESLMDTCNSPSMQQGQGNEPTDTKQKWHQKLPSYRSNSADSAYDPTLKSLTQKNSVDADDNDEDKVLSFWLWRGREGMDHDNSQRQSIPIAKSSSTSIKEPPMYPASCDSGLETASIYSEQSRDSRRLKRQSMSSHKPDSISSHRGIPLSYISEKAESSNDRESIATSKASPTFSFDLQDQANEIPLQRQSIQRGPGLAL